MKIAVMQPYLFPYIGYFHLIMSSDIFVLYDDVNFMKKSFINRNNILLAGEAYRFTLSVLQASQNSLINELEYSDYTDKLIKTFSEAYSKAPYFQNIFPIIESCLNFNDRRISCLCLNSINAVLDYLGIYKNIVLSSSLGYDRKGTAAEKLISICRVLGGDVYINSPGGRTLYNRTMFEPSGIDLKFVESEIEEYEQVGTNNFVGCLSIVDVLMNNSIQDVRRNFFSYEVVDI